MDAAVSDAVRKPAIRGRRRETWSVTTTATIMVRDHQAVRDAFTESAESAYTLAVLDEPGPDETEELTSLGQVAWLVWPTEGLDAAVEAGAFRVDSVGVEVLDDQGDRGTLRWEVTVKLREVDGLRRLAVEAHPDEAPQIAENFAVAWQRAVDPFAPIRVVPGIDWTPGSVDVTHVPARVGRRT